MSIPDDLLPQSVSHSSSQTSKDVAQIPGFVHVQGCDSILATATALVEQGQRRLDVFSNHLLPQVYGTPSFAAAVQALALRHQKVRIRMLVRDPRAIIKSGHRLHALASRLPSRISLRQADPESESPECMLLVDGKAYLCYTDEDNYVALDRYRDFGTCRLLAERFETCWHHGIVPDELRGLRL